MQIHFGSSLNYSRVVNNSKNKDSNCDYNILLVIYIPIIFLIGIYIIKRYYTYNIINVVLYSILIFFTIARYYADVEYRINLNYKGYFIYYLLITIGYIIGVLFYNFINSWFIVIIIGELLGITFVKINGKIFNRPYFQKSKYFYENTKYNLTLIVANFIEAIVGNIDKIIILSFIGAKEVTIFYTATLLGKTASLITSPLNTVIISYIVKLKNNMTKKIFIKILFILIFVVVILSIFTTVCSHILIKYLYRDVYEEASKFFIIGNLGQILNFIAITITVIFLKFVDKKYQIYVNLIHLIVFLGLIIPLSIKFGISGMIYGLLVANLIKFLLASLVGIIKIK